MVLTNLISCYRGMIARDGKMTKKEIKEALLLDDELSPEYKHEEKLNEIAEKILFTKQVEYKKRSNKEMNESRMILYKQGYNDYEIANIEGVFQSAIYLWRKRNNLKPNYRINPNHEKWKKLYNKGYDDKTIAKLTSVSRTAIYNWRKKHNLPSHNKRAMERTNNNV